MTLPALRAFVSASVACLLLLGGVAPAARAAEVKVFLLGGQSNMVGQARTDGLPAALQAPQEDVLLFYRYQGETFPLTTLRPGSGNHFGPEVTFGRTVADALPDESFALIKAAGNGTSLSASWDPETGNAYAAFRETVTGGLAALTAAGHTPRIVGMLWAQGEADGLAGRTTAQYEADLIEFIADIRERYGEDLPFFFNRLSTGQTQLSEEELAQIRAAQQNVDAADPFAYMVDADGLKQGDKVHFNAEGQVELGQRFGEAYLATLPEPTTSAMLSLGGLVLLRGGRE